MTPSVLSNKTEAPRNLLHNIYRNLNFYRVHLLFFTFTPLVFSGIFYASNGRYKISYVDALFNCVSAMTVCGLATINLSSLTGFQQALLFVLMCIGNPVLVSWVIVYMRRYFFARKFENILEAVAAKKAASIIDEDIKKHKPWPHRFVAFFSGKHLSVEDEEQAKEEIRKEGGAMRKLRPEMIRRMDDAPKLVNPSGWVSEGKAPSMRKASVSSNQAVGRDNNSLAISIDFIEPPKRQRRLSDPGRPSRPNSPTNTKMQRYETVADTAPTPPGSPKRFSRTQTVEFAPTPQRPSRKGHILEHGTLFEEPHHDPNMLSPNSNTRFSRMLPPTQSIAPSIHTHHTWHTAHSTHSHAPTRSMHKGFGGFPSPFTILQRIIRHWFPTFERKLTRTVTVPATVSVAPSGAGDREGKKQVPYISFEAVVGRNSAFHALTSEQLDEIGGVEYRALNALLWLIPSYHFGIQLMAFIVIAPYVSLNRWTPVFEQQIRPLNRVWFSAYQVVSAYTNTGTSLVDQSMLPFQKAYPMIVAMIFLILAGNTCFPIFLRFLIWCISKSVPKTSHMHETLHFLLDHPRRCFIYLFPSHQTWFLLTIVLGLTFIDWTFFLTLDLWNPVINAIPTGVRVLDGFFQATAVRAAGFGIVPLASVAPGLKVLYVVMMYISVFPIAMSVRSTNVYEEQSLGVFHADPDPNDEQSFEASGPRMNVWSRYLTMHARRQLAFDMWWLALSLFLICIIERTNLENPAQFGWFNIFYIIFELVSAYGTVGLSLGIPDQNYSFVGAMHTLSKLIICLVMLRGRHRGLPVAIDRAVMLPSEFKKDEELDNRSHYSLSRNDSLDRRALAYSESLNGHTPDIRQRMRRFSTKHSSNEQHQFPNQMPTSPHTEPGHDTRRNYELHGINEDRPIHLQTINSN
ncbi:hypothetical protein CPC08DRAFT_750168 [Agrocybe pediades]|nr:hypothetical protein CPC08DRAFT_750168 [Agrocybe pediades]